MPPREKLRAIAAFIVDSYRHEPDLMKVIIVEVTRAANTFGRTHLDKIREAYAGIARIVERAQPTASSGRVTPTFAAQAFYGSIEQVLTRLDLRPRRRSTTEEFERAKTMIVEMICGGLERDGATGVEPDSTAVPIGVAAKGSSGTDASMSD